MADDELMSLLQASAGEASLSGQLGRWRQMVSQTLDAIASNPDFVNNSNTTLEGIMADELIGLLQAAAGEASLSGALGHWRQRVSETVDKLAAGSGTMTADYVIVGLGTAGAPLARYLSEDMKTSVIVLEAGRDQQNNPIVTSPANVIGDTTLTPTSPNMPVSTDPSLNFIYSVDGSNLILDNRAVFTNTGGRMWGGSSAHATLFATRGTPSVYDQWGAVNAQWSYNSLLPLMKFTEKYTSNGSPIDATQRGVSGPILITQRPPHQASTFFTTMAAVLSTPDVTDYNAPPTGDTGISSLQQYVGPGFTTRSWSQAFLPPSVMTTDADGNGQGVGGRQLTVISSATAFKILFDEMNGPTATGVRYFLGGNPNAIRTVFARKKVILASGTMESPKLLQLSGIGPSAVLAKFGITPVMINENVGRNVQNHTSAAVVLPQFGGSPTPINQVVMNWWDGSNSVTPNGQANDGVRRFVVPIFTSNLSIIPARIVTSLGLNAATSIAVGGGLFRDTPKNGTIDIVSTDPLTTPLYTAAYYQDVAPPGGKSSLDRIVDFWLAAADISLGYSGAMPSYPPASFYPNTFPGGTFPAGDTSGLRILIREDALIPFLLADHYTGSCRMSSSAATGVVDGNLNVHGVGNLAIADNSVIPEIVDGHTMFAPMIIGLQKAKIEGAVGLP